MTSGSALVNKSPAWITCRQALARVAKAGARLTEAQVDNPADLDAAEVEFAAALLAYDMAPLAMVSPKANADIVDLSDYRKRRRGRAGEHARSSEGKPCPKPEVDVRFLPDRRG